MKLANARRRFGWRSSVALFTGYKYEDSKPALPANQEKEKKRRATEEFAQHAAKVSRADRKAKESAMIVRSLIIGPSAAPPTTTKSNAVAKAKLAKVKAELLQPKSANRVIAQLRSLPSSGKLGSQPDGVQTPGLPHGPIHAVCLAYTDSEAHEKHFSQLSEGSIGTSRPSSQSREVVTTTSLNVVASVTTAPITKLTTLFTDLRIVSLITSPDLGIGQPGDGPGLLSGAIPTAETVINGVTQITPQLMALGYATGKAILPDHAGVYPPTDRMSVITYWWGFEIAMPPPSIQFLGNVPSIAHAIVNFLTGVSLVNNGVQEILPFVRYISQYIDSEFSMIQGQDQGKGVVCAATWIMPVALVPRPWDFPDPPDSTVQPDNPSTVPASPPTDIERPSSPILFPPLPNTNTNMDRKPIISVAPNQAPPIDDTPVVATNAIKDMPQVKVIPPTPPAFETLRGAPPEIVVAAA
ncbi:hypothetical protein C8Q75DRAFT_712993 [Abortiporus biennis]|nr:hypothetical protein C8Q75DRAFT_712993 [Abortiporus biennis]